MLVNTYFRDVFFVQNTVFNVQMLEKIKQVMLERSDGALDYKRKGNA
jgi:hypothetical protein